ncbi:fatty acid desaturase-domain-containing protein [Fomitopsis betulina]|nr:fatty acid desaturase-domain-containing protein [Fomitopsis betulina]
MGLQLQKPSADQHPTIWWSNGMVFVATHLAAAIGCCYYPFHDVPRNTLILCAVLFQFAEFSITIGYHRLYSHRAFCASLPVRILVALLGASAMQGSIKWWCLRHRLHHRYTDDPVHDPYAATRGFLWAHMGWIFFKPRYERLELIDRADLDNDPVVRLQHKYYLPLAISMGLVLPPCIGSLWGDAMGSFIWAALVARLLIWHCTFFVNSLAHWDGLQPYSDENTSKSNLILALLTCGEGNHNFHAFPHDYRSGPAPYDWDPSKWAILLLQRLGLAWGLKRARPEDVHEAHTYMLHKHAGESSGGDASCSSDGSSEDDAGNGDFATAQAWVEWGLEDVQNTKGKCVLVLDGFVVDATVYLSEHPGGAALLRKYSVRSDDVWKEAGWAFHGGMNNHSRAARRRMRELRVAKFVGPEM